MDEVLHYFDSPLHGPLAYRVWPPAVGAPARGTLVFLHGWGDHGGRYAPLARRLSTWGMTCLAPDFAGHGRSAGPRAVVHDFCVLQRDLEALLEQHAPARPLVLCGHSMGGCLATHFAIHRPERVDGLILNSAALAVSPHVSRLKRAASIALGAVAPRLRVGVLKRPEHMACEAAAQRVYAEDPLVHHGAIDAGTGRCLLSALEWLTAHRAELRAPFLALQGECDELVAVEGAAALRNAAPVASELLIVPGARHDLLLELGAELLAAHMIGWLERASLPGLAHASSSPRQPVPP